MSGWASLDAQVAADDLDGATSDTLKAFWAGSSGALHRAFTLRSGELPAPPAEAARTVLTLMEREVEAAWFGDDLWLGGHLHVRVHPGGAAFTVSPAGTTPEAWALAFTEAHRAGGWLPLHAAVLARGGRGVAVTGVSGAGKSTATLRLLDLGFTVLSEDRAFWHAPTGRVMGLDRVLRAFPDSVERFAPKLLAEALQRERDLKGKLVLPLPRPSEEAVHLARVLLLTPQESTLDGAARVRAAWEMSGVPLTALARQQVQAGITGLLPLLDSRTVTRDTVIPAVQALLES